MNNGDELNEALKKAEEDCHPLIRAEHDPKTMSTIYLIQEKSGGEWRKCTQDEINNFEWRAYYNRVGAPPPSNSRLSLHRSFGNSRLSLHRSFGKSSVTTYHKPYDNPHELMFEMQDNGEQLDDILSEEDKKPSVSLGTNKTEMEEEILTDIQLKRAINEMMSKSLDEWSKEIKPLDTKMIDWVSKYNQYPDSF